MTTGTVPISFDDPVNAAILAVSEDQLRGFQRDPLGEIARRSGVDEATVIERVRAMLRAGTIRRVRQTLLSTSLAPGALVAWQVSASGGLQAAFDFMFQQDPFSGHVVLRTTDAVTPGSSYKLWTTLKVPQGYSIEKHCGYLLAQTGAERYRLMPAKKLFALGVGHTRRRGMEPGSKSDEPAEVTDVSVTELSELEWRALTALKREFAPEEITGDLWRPRAQEAGVALDQFFAIAASFEDRKLIGRFSTFLEHVKPVAGGTVTRYNALFHWAVPPGREIEAGREVGRHHILTHCYWREAGPEFNNVNIMGVVHGTDKGLLLQHKAAIDAHLASAGMPVTYTNVFWGGRSEIKPSEVSPIEYAAWCRSVALDPEAMRA